MATNTFRKEVKREDGWLLLASGPCNLLLKVNKDRPLVKIIIQPTGLPSQAVNNDNYFDLEWDDVALSVSLLTGESLYYSIEAGHRSTFCGIQQG